MLRIACVAQFIIAMGIASVAYTEEKVTLSESNIKSQYLYNFIELIQWPKEVELAVLTVGFYGYDTALLAESQRLLTGVSVRGKPVRLKVISGLGELADTNVLVVSKIQSKRLDSIASRFVKSNMLIVSDGATDKKSIMINFTYSDDERISFEINKSNMIYEGLRVSDDILLYGGSEIDVALLYKELALSLFNTKEKLEHSKVALSGQLKKIQLQDKEIKRRREQIKSAATLVDSSKRQLDDKRNQLHEYEKELAKKKRDLDIANSEIRAVLTQRETDVSLLEQRIDENETVLKQQVNQIELHKLQLEDKIIAVQQLGSTIQTQEKMLNASIALFSVVILLLLSLFANHRRKKAMEHERAVHQATESILRLKSDFLTAISHELRTPMHGILGGLEIAQQVNEAKFSAPLELVKKSAADMMALINDILSYTELKAGDLRETSESVAIAPLLERLERRYRALCESKKVQLLWRVDNNIPQWLLLEEDRLTTVLEKVLDNAVKFTTLGHIGFSCDVNDASSPTGLIITVHDTGIGIDAEEQETIYEAFQQSDGGFQRRYSGLGIGLCIAYQLVETMHGTIDLYSEPGKGSCYTITLPLTVVKAPERELGKPLVSADAPILVVEDNQVNQEVLIKMLENLGYHSLIANHGEEALKLLDAEDISLILMDLQMPIMDGFTCTEKIRNSTAEHKKIPIIAVTANLMKADKKRCVEAGMNDYLAKPVSMGELQRSLANFIEMPGIKTGHPSGAV
jgi:signal transduction histidine kinase/CheY-like chemotaxis protein